MELKAFQRTALQTLETYLERARLTADPERAFGETVRQREPERSPPPYRTIPGLPHITRNPDFSEDAEGGGMKGIVLTEFLGSKTDSTGPAGRRPGA